MFNGIELQNGENIEDYINKVVNKAIHTTEETKKALVNKSIFEKKEEETATDTDTDTDTDMDTDTDTDDEDKLYMSFNKRLMLTTHKDMDHHDKAVQDFNSVYGTAEKGSNGSSCNYFTHGEKVYNLIELKRLHSLYKLDIDQVKINNRMIDINFIDCNNELEHKTIPQQTVLRTIKKAKQHINDNKHLNIKDGRLFQCVLDNEHINNRLTHNNITKRCNDVNTVVKYNGEIYQVLKMYEKKNKIKIMRLIPHLVLSHRCIDYEDGKTNQEVNIYKYIKYDMKEPKSKKVNIDECLRYTIDDYLLYVKINDHY